MQGSAECFGGRSVRQRLCVRAAGLAHLRGPGLQRLQNRALGCRPHTHLLHSSGIAARQPALGEHVWGGVGKSTNRSSVPALPQARCQSSQGPPPRPSSGVPDAHLAALCVMPPPHRVMRAPPPPVTAPMNVHTR